MPLSNGVVTEDISGLIPGTYSVVATSQEGCDTTVTFVVDNTASIIDNEIDDFEMTIMPNPAIDFFFVEYVIPNEGNAELMITNTLGQIIQSWNINGENKLKINSNSLQAGVYFITIRTESATMMKRLIIDTK